VVAAFFLLEVEVEVVIQVAGAVQGAEPEANRLAVRDRRGQRHPEPGQVTPRIIVVYCHDERI